MSIRQFLTELGLERYADSFEENGIEVEILPELEEADLPDLGVKLLGHRKKLMRAIRLQGPSSKELVAQGQTAPSPPVEEPPAVKPLSAAPAAPQAKPAVAKKVKRTDVTAEGGDAKPAKSEAQSSFKSRPKRRLKRDQEMSATIIESVDEEGAEAEATEEAPKRPTRKRATSGPRMARARTSALGRIPGAPEAASSEAPSKPQEMPAVPAPEAAPASESGPAKVARGKKKSGFSETQWFMAGATQDADLLEAKVEDQDYDHDAEITEETRKAYTLREEDS